MGRVVGVDGVGKRWLAVVLDDGAFADAMVVADLRDVPEAKVVCIDMFIALGTSGPREVDRWCRRQVGRLSSSVFNAPPRSIVIDHSIVTHAEARRRIRPDWPGMSIQTFGLVPKIRAVREFARRRPGVVFEAHPEVCFARLAGEPLSHRKKTWKGQHDRRGLLAGAGLDLVGVGDTDAAGCPVDDVLDAAVVALTGHLWLEGGASRFPSSAGATVLAPRSGGRSQIREHTDRDDEDSWQREDR